MLHFVVLRLTNLANLAVLMSSRSISGSNSLLFRSLLSLLYFSMVRISTFFPATHPTFDRTCHLNLNDIVFMSSGFALLVKWANNILLPTLLKSQLSATTIIMKFVLFILFCFTFRLLR